MDWKAIASLAAPFAPTVGKILGGFIPFPGGAMLGEWAGERIAAALGVEPTPEAVGTAIQTMPQNEVATRLQAVENEAVAKWDALAKIAESEAEDRTAQSQAINETQRSEIASGVSWWHWRHQIGYTVLVYAYGSFAAIGLALAGKVDVNSLVLLMNASTIITGGLFALLGYIAQDSTKLKTTAITGQQAPSLTDSVVTTVKTVAAKVVPPKAIVVGKPVGRREVVSGL